MTSWNCLTISGPMTLIGGVVWVGAFTVAMEFSSVGIKPEQTRTRNWTMVLPILSYRLQSLHACDIRRLSLQPVLEIDHSRKLPPAHLIRRYRRYYRPIALLPSPLA